MREELRRGCKKLKIKGEKVTNTGGGGWGGNEGDGWEKEDAACQPEGQKRKKCGINK